MATDPFAMLRTRNYIVLLVFAAVLGVPISAAAFAFLELVDGLQTWVFDDLPDLLGFDGAPTWWPVLPLVVAGLVVGAIIRFLPGRGGHSPADGFKTERAAGPVRAPGHPARRRRVARSRRGGRSRGAADRPGRRARRPRRAVGQRGTPAQALAVVGGAGSFAAIATLLGSPLLGAFLLMEVIGLGGAMATLMLLPGLLAAGVGALVFLGFDAVNGVGTISLAVPNLPPFDHPDGAQFGWALAIGVGAAVVGSAIRVLGLTLRPHLERRLLLLTPVAGLAIAVLAILYAEVSGKGPSDVLFSGQAALPVLVNEHASTRSGRCCCSSPASRSGTASRSPASAADRSSRPCSSAVPAASPWPGCPGWTSCPRSPWGSGR